MCYYVTQKTNPKKIAQHYNAGVEPRVEELFEPYYLANGFAHPKLSVVLQREGQLWVDSMQWGLMNNWKKPYTEMLKSSNNTLNAKSETIFDLVSFKNNILTRRCVVPVENFFEYKHVEEDKLPYVIQSKGQSFLNLAGIYAHYQDPENGLWHSSFSVCTTAANEFMSSIHNSKFRQPVLLKDVQVSDWLNPDSSKEMIQHLMEPGEAISLQAYRAPRNLLKLGNTAAVLQEENI